MIIMEQEFQFFDDSECEFDNSNALEGNSLTDERVLKVRLDKWLWAARFFKTRALARAAVEAGKVFYDGMRSKASREIEIGAQVHVAQGPFEHIVIVKGLSTRRRSTEEALQLFDTIFKTEPNKNVHQEKTTHHFQDRTNFKPYPPIIKNQRTMGNFEQKERKPTRFLRRSVVRQGNRLDQKQPMLNYDEDE